MKLILSTCLAVLAFVLCSSAATLTVNTLIDSDDNVCDSQCSLREAVKVAAVGDTIIFDRSIRGGTINLKSSISFTKRLIIDGPNVRRITLKGNNTFRIIDCRTVLSIDGLIIRDGAEPNGDGGGIYSSGVLNLTNVAILDSSALHGGGIFVSR